MINDIKIILDRLTDIELAECWCKLNIWECPLALIEVFPIGWENKDIDFKYEFSLPIMRYIEGKIGHKKCNRIWNKKSMTDEEHEIFYSEHYFFKRMINYDKRTISKRS